MDKKKPTTTSSATGGQKSKQIPNSSKAAATASAEQPDNVTRRGRILQNFRLIWLDTHIDETNEDFRNSITQLRSIVNTIDPFTDPDQCTDFLSEIKDEKAFMIVSGALGQRMVPLLHDMEQLNAIYVFCGSKSRHEQWAKDWPKVKGVFTDTKPICDSLKQVARQCDQDSISISLVPASQASNQNLDQLDQSFMYTQILKEILLEIDDYGEQSIKELTAYCREQCADLNNIAKFEHDYHLQSPIWWYTYECFLYPMLNRALRMQEMNTIVNMGFFIRHLHQQIQQLHDEQFGHQQVPTPFIVYRGQGLSQNNFENMQKTKGGLLAFNNFLSTSKNSDISLGFAKGALANPENVGILFKMTINPAVSSSPFADVEKVSYYKEEEILFSMHTVFRIHDIVRIGKNNRLWQVELTLTADNDQQLNALTESMQQETQKGSKGWYRLGILLITVGEFNRAEQVYQVLLDQAHDDSEKAHVYNQLGWIKYNQGDYAGAISFYEKDLEISQKSLPPNHPDLASSYNNIGLVYNSMGDYSKALSYYEKDLEISQESLPPNHPDLAASYNNIGLVYYSTGDYSKALSSHEKALEIRQKSLPPNHPDLASSHTNIGSVYYSTGDYSKALQHYEKALEIQQKSLPPNHPSLADSYSGIGLVYSNMGEYPKALSSHEKALEIKQKSLPSNHPSLAASHNNIGSVYNSMSEYSKALSSHEKSLEIKQKSLPPNHPDLGISYNNIGDEYYQMGEYSKSLPFCQRAVEIAQRSLPQNHPHLQQWRRNLENVKKKLNK